MKWQKSRKNGPAEEDLNKVKETLIRERETRLKENNFWISALQGLYLNGDRLLTLDEYKTFVNSFTSKDIKKIAAEISGYGKLCEGCVDAGTKADVKNP